MCFRNASLKFLILSMLIMWLSFGVCLTMLGSEIGGTMPTYTVKQGEDWISLAAKLQVPLQNLLNLNPDIKSLSAGTGLRVPRVPASAATQTLAGQTPKSGGKGFLQGQGPPRPEGKGVGRLRGGQLPTPPRYTPPAGKPYRPYQPPGGGKGAPPPPAPRPPPPQYKPGVQPRMILPPRPQPVFQSQRREQALTSPGPFPQPPQPAAAAQYYAPQYGGGYGATANLRAFPGARATATVTPRTRRIRYGAAGQWAAGLGAGVGGAVEQFTGAVAAGARQGYQAGAEAGRPGWHSGVGPAAAGFAQGFAPAYRPEPGFSGHAAAQLPVTERLPMAATDAGEVQGADGNWYGYVRLHNAVTDEPGHMYPTVDPETGKTMEPWKMYYQALQRGEPPPQMSEAVRMALEPFGLTKDAMSVDWGYTWDEKSGFWVWGAQEEEGPQTLGYGGGGGYGGGYGYYGGGGGGGGGYQYSYPNYPTYEQQQQSYLPGRDRLPVGRFGLVSWRI